MAERPSTNVEIVSDIVGEESMMGRRTQTGAILEMMDVCAARVAYKHGRCNVVTAAVDVVVLFHPVLHMDLIKMEGRIATVSGSSMVIQVKAFRQDIPSRDFQLVLCGYVTTVGINKDGTPKKDLPPAQYDSPEEEAALLAEVKRRRDLSTQWTQLQERVNVADLTFELVEDEANRGKKEYLTMEETILTVRRNFFPKHVNINNTIFGGEIMLWMDRVAIQCARTFTRSSNIVTICLNRVFFKKPLYITDWVELVSRVVYVRVHTLEVEVEVWLERLDGTRMLAHSGFFIILHYNDVGYKQEIITGLKLTNTDSLGRYYRARQRFLYWKQYDSKAGGDLG